MQIPRSACKTLTAYVHHDNHHPCQYFHPPYAILFTDAAESEARFVVILKKPKEGRLGLRAIDVNLGRGWTWVLCSCLAGKYSTRYRMEGGFVHSTKIRSYTEDTLV